MLDSSIPDFEIPLGPIHKGCPAIGGENLGHDWIWGGVKHLVDVRVESFGIHTTMHQEMLIDWNSILQYMLPLLDHIN